MSMVLARCAKHEAQSEAAKATRAGKAFSQKILKQIPLPEC